MPFEPVGGEHLVPVVTDPTAGPAVAAAAHQTHGIGVRGREERRGRRGTPVDQQPAARAVGEADASDVQGLGVVGTDHVSKTQVQAEAVQGAQPARQPVDLLVAVHRLPAEAAGVAALGVETGGEFGDRLLEALRDRREVLLVAGDQLRVGFGGQPVGKVERAGGRGGHVVDMHFVDHSFPQVRASACDSAGRRGPCRKPPGALYVESGKECRSSVALLFRPSWSGGFSGLLRSYACPGGGRTHRPPWRRQLRAQEAPLSVKEPGAALFPVWSAW